MASYGIHISISVPYLIPNDTYPGAQTSEFASNFVALYLLEYLFVLYT